MDSVTWDGHPISREPPFGATVVVYRRAETGAEFLVLHRPHAAGRHGGVDWVWTPPSGARYPGEEIGACAARELAEETGLHLVPGPIRLGDAEWYLYAAEMAEPEPIRLSAEHDEWRWVPLARALEMCRPEVVAEGIGEVAAALGLG